MTDTKVILETGQWIMFSKTFSRHFSVREEKAKKLSLGLSNNSEKVFGEFRRASNPGLRVHKHLFVSGMTDVGASQKWRHVTHRKYFSPIHFLTSFPEKKKFRARKSLLSPREAPPPHPTPPPPPLSRHLSLFSSFHTRGVVCGLMGGKISDEKSL